MFATLRISGQNQEPLCVESSRPGPRAACQTCRDKKLKCTGDKEGCDRCRSKNITCTYLASKVNKGQKRRKLRPSSTDPTVSPRMRSSDSSSGGSTQAFKNQQSLPLPRDSTRNASQDKDVGGQVPDTTRMLSPVDDLEPNCEPLTQTNDMKGAGIEGPGGDSVFDFSVADDMDLLDSYLMSDLTPSDKLTADLLNFDFGMTPLQPLSCDRADELQKSSTPDRSSPMTAARASCHAWGDLIREGESSEASVMLPSPDYSTSQFSERRSGLQEYHKKYASLSSSSSVTSCQCMQNLLLLYEEVETKRAGDSTTLMDCRLGFQKSVLSQCNGILRCKECRRISAIAMLMITICERLVCSFQSISERCFDRLRYYQQRHNPDFPLRRKVSSEEDLGGNQKVHIGGYGVESPQEQVFLVIRVVELQIMGLRRILTRLNDAAVDSGWEKHIPMLHPIDQQIQQTMLNLRQAANDALDEHSGSLFGRLSL